MVLIGSYYNKPNAHTDCYYNTCMCCVSCNSIYSHTDYSFRREPEQYYYAFPNTAQIINCEAIETRDDGTEQLIDVIIFKNSERVDPDRPPDGVLLLVTEGHIAGILIVSVRTEDSGSIYQCVVEINGERKLSSLSTTLFVGGTHVQYLYMEQ